MAAAGDDGAWRDFCQRYGELILGVARQHGFQPADREDVLQDVLIELTRSLPGFRYDPAKGKFRGYLRSIILRVIQRRFGQKAPAGPQSSIDQAQQITSPPLSDDDAWETEWRRYHVQRAMRVIEAEFSEVNRMAFALCTVYGKSATQAAEALGISLDRVYQTKSRILRRLTEIIEQQVDDEG